MEISSFLNCVVLSCVVILCRRVYCKTLFCNVFKFQSYNKPFQARNWCHVRIQFYIRLYWLVFTSLFYLFCGWWYSIYTPFRNLIGCEGPWDFAPKILTLVLRLGLRFLNEFIIWKGYWPFWPMTLLFLIFDKNYCDYTKLLTRNRLTLKLCLLRFSYMGLT